MKPAIHLAAAKWLLPLSLILLIFLSCQKEISQKQQQELQSAKFTKPW